MEGFKRIFLYPAISFNYFIVKNDIKDNFDRTHLEVCITTKVEIEGIKIYQNPVNAETARDVTSGH